MAYGIPRVKGRILHQTIHPTVQLVCGINFSWTDYIQPFIIDTHSHKRASVQFLEIDWHPILGLS